MMKRIVFLAVLGFSACSWLGVVASEPAGQQHAAITKRDLDEAAAVLASLTPKEQDALKQLVASQLQGVSARDLDALRETLCKKIDEKVESKRGYLGVQFATIIAATALLLWLGSIAAKNFVDVHHETYTVTHYNADGSVTYERPFATTRGLREMVAGLMHR